MFTGGGMFTVVVNIASGVNVWYPRGVRTAMYCRDNGEAVPVHRSARERYRDTGQTWTDPEEPDFCWFCMDEIVEVGTLSAVSLPIRVKWLLIVEWP